MAFSTNQLQYLESILAANSKTTPGGYYVAWNEAISSGGADPDLHIIISEEPIRLGQKGYDSYLSEGAVYFNGEGAALRFDVITGNPSGYNPDTSNRIEVTPYGTGDGFVAYIPGYDTISTNADMETLYGVALFGDVFGAEGGYNYETQINTSGALGIIGALCLFTVFFVAFFRR